VYDMVPQQTTYDTKKGGRQNDVGLSSFFFPLSARGPTRRRNSTGLAELWGGWPIELVPQMSEELGV
jgi:hypothetical protein